MKKFEILNDNITLVTHSSFNDELIKFAYNHNFNIKYENINHSNFEKDVLKLIDLGYSFNFEKEIVGTPYGCIDSLYGVFIHPINKFSHDDKDERKIISTCMNYLYRLASLVSAHDFAYVHGFKYDSHNFDFLESIKDQYSNNTLNTDNIMKSDAFKNIQIELNKLYSREEK